MRECAAQRYRALVRQPSNSAKHAEISTQAGGDGATKLGSGRVAPIVGDRHCDEVERPTGQPGRSAPDGGEPWRFVLVVGPAPDKPPFVLNRLAVCVLGSGATLLEEPFGPMVRIRFDWPASTRAEAIAAAIRKTESVGLRVLRVDNDDWVTVADVAHRVGRSRETIRLWASGHKGPGVFPPPANPRRDTTFYSWAEVLPWLRERRGLDLPEEEPTLVAANLAVQLRALLPRVPAAGVILDLLHEPGSVKGTAGVV